MEKIMQKTTTFFTFVGEQYGKAEEAIRFYTSLFKNSEITHLDHYGPGENEPEGMLKFAIFTLDGQEYMASESGYAHAWSFSPAISILVACESEEEIEKHYAALSEGGFAMMPLGNYGFSKKFAWVADRYGVSWQLRLD
jgi:predicted 3-demethylubiquinone-9 3-methyltransferase (glyoxalase superfamily)